MSHPETSGSGRKPACPVWTGDGRQCTRGTAHKGDHQFEPETSDIYTVAIQEAQEVQIGDVIWAPDDGDWCVVHSIGGKFQPTFSRVDGGRVYFDYDESKVLVRR